MVDYCKTAIYKMIAGDEENVSKRELVNGLIDRWNIIRKENPDREVQTILLRDFIADMKSNHMAAMFSEWNRVTKFLANEEYISNPTFNGNAYQAINSMLGENVSIAKGTGQNLISKINGNRAMFIDNFYHSLGTRNLINATRSGDYDLDVAKYLMDGVKPNDPNAQFIGDMLKHATDVMYHSKVQAGIPLKYRENYLVKTFHDPEKIASAGFSDWAVAILNYTKAADYFKDIPVDDKAALSKALQSRANLEDMVGTNGVVDRLYEDFTRFKSMFDPVTQEYRSPLIYENPKASTAEIRSRGRTYVFRDAESWHGYNQQFGRYNNLFDAYVADARAVAKENAFISQFGPSPKRGFDDLIEHAKTFMGLSPADVTKLQQRYAVAAEGLPAPDSATATIGQGVSGANAVSKLGYAAIKQLLDPASIGLHYYTKSGDNYASAIFKTVGDYIASVPENLIPPSLKNEGMRYMYHTAQTMHEETLKELLEDGSGIASKAVRLSFKLSGMEVMNRISYVTAFKSVMRIVKNTGKLSKESELFLSKYELSKSDLDFIQPLMQRFNIKSPSQLVWVVPSEEFAKNPLGLSSKRYQHLIASRLNNMLIENVKQFTPIPTRDMKVRMVQAANMDPRKVLDPNGFAYWIFSAIHQYKTVAIKTFMDNQNLISLRTGKDFSSPNWKSAAMTDPKAYHHYAAAIVTSGIFGALVYYLGERVNGKDHDKVVREFNKNPEEGTIKILADSYGLGIMGDIIMGADPDARSPLLATPAMQTYFGPFNIARAAIAAGAKSHGKDYIDRATAKEVVDFAGNILPLRGTLLTVPIIQEKKRLEKELIKSIQRLD